MRLSWQGIGISSEARQGVEGISYLSALVYLILKGRNNERDGEKDGYNCNKL